MWLSKKASTVGIDSRKPCAFGATRVTSVRNPRSTSCRDRLTVTEFDQDPVSSFRSYPAFSVCRFSSMRAPVMLWFASTGTCVVRLVPTRGWGLPGSCRRNRLSTPKRSVPCSICRLFCQRTCPRAKSVRSSLKPWCETSACSEDLISPQAGRGDDQAIEPVS